MNLNKVVLQDITERLKAGEHVKPSSNEEKECFRILHDLDHVNGHVQGSKTQRKYMRDEIWALTSYLGAPSWFVTFLPADVKHPIALYFAGTKQVFEPSMEYDSNEANRLISENPAAGARFFHVMVENFIKHVLGVDAGHEGLFGDTAGYYGTVEQQGRLTLHLHLLVWIRGSLSPQEIRQRMISEDSTFQKAMVQYLEGCHAGEFSNGTMEDWQKRSSEYSGPDPATELPDAPHHVRPENSRDESRRETTAGDADGDEDPATSKRRWWAAFHEITDMILFRSNRHSCRVGVASAGC
jgi:hypothetical protein